MQPVSFSRLSEDYRRVEQALEYLQKNRGLRPDLRDAAGSVHLSEYHFQRLFKRWAGITPKQFLQYLTLDHAKQLLRDSRSVLDAAYEAGLSGPGRLHDLFVSLEAVTPGQFKEQGGGLKIRYGFHPSPFGKCFIAVTERGICALAFAGAGKTAEESLLDCKRQWPVASFVRDSAAAKALIQRIFSGQANDKVSSPLRLAVKGTNFQVKVWEALLTIPEGCVVSYEAVAKRIGKPQAARAVGNAVGANPVAYIIPCHRVIKSIGVPGSFRWGASRKKVMLAWEAAQRPLVRSAANGQDKQG